MQRMNDLEILQEIHKELKTLDHPPLAPTAIDLYGKLIARVPEEGFELMIADKDLGIDAEESLRLLNRYEYVVSDWHQQTRDGCFYHVNLRGKRFLDLANGRICAVVVGPMRDSGARQAFETGAVRDSAEGKTRPDLVSPFAMERLGEWLRLGAMKYAERNWEKGIPISRTLSSLYRHLLKFQAGATDEDHMAACMCNAMFIIHTQEMIRRGVLPESLNDMPDYSAIPGAHKNGDAILDHEPEEEFKWKKMHDNI